MGFKDLSLFICLCFCLLQLSDATTYFVSPTGADSGAGNITDPFQTITKAVQLLQDGDDVKFYPGVYNFTKLLQIGQGSVSFSAIDPSNVTLISTVGLFSFVNTTVEARFEGLNFEVNDQDGFRGTTNASVSFYNCNFTATNARFAYSFKLAAWEMRNCHITGSQSSPYNDFGYLIHLQNTNVSLIDTVFEDATCNSGDCKAPVFFYVCPIITLERVAFRRLTANYAAPLMVSRCPSVQIINSTIEDCITVGAEGQAGGGFVSIDSSVRIVGSAFRRNFAQDYASALLVDGSTLTIESTEFSSNVVALNESSPFSKQGSTLIIQATNFTCDSCVFDNNTGGPLGVDLTVLDPYLVLMGSTILRNCSFVNHNSSGAQALVHIQKTPLLRIDDCLVAHNLNLFAAFHIAYLDTTNNVISNLVVRNNTYSRVYPATIYIYRASLDFYNLHLEHNTNIENEGYDHAIGVYQNSTVHFWEQPADVVLPSIQAIFGGTVHFHTSATVRGLSLFYDSPAGPNRLVLYGTNLTIDGPFISYFVGGSGVVDAAAVPGNAWVINRGVMLFCCTEYFSDPLTFDHVNLHNQNMTYLQLPNVTFVGANLLNQAQDNASFPAVFRQPYYTPAFTLTVDNVINRGLFELPQLLLNGNFISDSPDGTVVKFWSNFHSPDEFLINGTVSISDGTLEMILSTFSAAHPPNYGQVFQSLVCLAGPCDLNFTKYSIFTGSGYGPLKLVNGTNSVGLVVETFEAKYVTYDSTATKLVAQFPRDTDGGGDGNCPLLLTPESLALFAEDVSCRWTSNRTLELSSSSLPNPYNDLHYIRFLPGVITDASDVRFKNGPQSAYPFFLGARPSVSAVLTAPPSIPSCADVTIDASASTGGGAFGLTFVWSISVLNSTDSVRSDLLQLITTSSTPSITIPSTLLDLNVVYGVNVSVSNIFNSTDSATAPIARRQSLIPPLILEGPIYRSHFASLPLRLNARLRLSDCLLRANVSLRLAWTQLSGPAISPTHLRGTTTPTLYISAFALAPNATYEFQLTATHAAETSQLTVTVEALPTSQLILHAFGDGTQHVSSPVEISLSLVDPLQSSTPTAQNVSFVWTILRCPGVLQAPPGVKNLVSLNFAALAAALSIQGQTVANNSGSVNSSNAEYDCTYRDSSLGVGWALNLTTLTNTLSAPAGLLEPGSYAFFVQARTSSGLYADTVVFLSLLPANSPAVPPTRINLANTRVLTTEVLHIDGMVAGLQVLDPRESAPTVAVEWGLVAFGVDLTRSDAMQTNRGALPLLLRPEALVPGRTYLVQLSAWYKASPDARSTHQLLLTANAGPSGGSLAVAPAAGTAGQTLFSISAANWNDENTPLRYEFALRADGREVLLSSRSESPNLLNVTLNLWSATSSTAEVVVRVFDLFGAVATSAKSVALLPPIVSATPIQITDGYNYLNASDTANLDQFIDNSLSHLEIDPNSTQSAREDLMKLLLGVDRVETADTVQRELGHLLRLNRLDLTSFASIPSDLLDFLTAKTTTELHRLLSSDSPLAGFSSASLDDQRNALALLEVIGSVSWNHNNSPYTDGNTTAILAALSVLDRLTLAQIGLSPVTAAPTALFAADRPSPLSMVSARESVWYLDGLALRSGANGVTLPSGFGNIVRQSLAKKKRSVSQDEVAVQFLEWSANSFPFAFHAASEGLLHPTVLSASILDSSGGRVAVSNLPAPVELKFSNLTGPNPRCVWWNSQFSTWDETGCSTQATESGVSCRCSHLTDFGLLFTTSPPPSPSPTEPDPNVGVAVGVTVAVVAAAATAIGIAAWKVPQFRHRLLPFAKRAPDALHTTELSDNTGNGGQDSQADGQRWADGKTAEIGITNT